MRRKPNGWPAARLPVTRMMQKLTPASGPVQWGRQCRTEEGFQHGESQRTSELTEVFHVIAVRGTDARWNQLEKPPRAPRSSGFLSVNYVTFIQRLAFTVKCHEMMCVQLFRLSRNKVIPNAMEETGNLPDGQTHTFRTPHVTKTQAGFRPMTDQEFSFTHTDLMSVSPDRASRASASARV